MLKNAIEMYNLYVDEKIGDFTQISSGGFKSNCVEQDKDLLKQFIIIKEYLVLKHIQQKSEKERKEKEGVLDEVHNVLPVFEENVTPDAFVEGESDVHTKVCDSEVISSEFSVSNNESQIKSSEIVETKILNLFLKPRNKKRKKKRKNESKTKKVWMPKVQVPIACEKVEKAEVNNVQRKFHSGEYVKGWRKEKIVFYWFNEFFGNFFFQLKSGYYFQKMIDFLQISGYARNQIQC
uniref:Uncharacterized protein n=1 Tax=Lactuca sativa TaxID=4236 RepID=A0A9R1XBB4_LACSA|nr:hypothetical protein LSAT_V11C500228880 [Lactuca sativa]